MTFFGAQKCIKNREIKIKKKLTIFCFHTANSGNWDMSYGFGIIRSCGIRTYKLQNLMFVSPWDIRIFSGFEFSGLIPIQIDGELNSERKIGLTLENWSTETGEFWSFEGFFFNFEEFRQFLYRTRSANKLQAPPAGLAQPPKEASGRVVLKT